MSRIADMAKRFITDPVIRFGYLNKLGLYKHMSDEAFLRKSYRIHLGETPDLKNPKTYNEKMQWLKLHDRKSIYTQMVDKYAMREFVAEKAGEEYLVPLLGVWERAEDIDFDALPEQFVLKCNHNSGLGMCVCRDKSKLDIQKVREKLKKGLAQDYYLLNREWPYKDVKRKITAEVYLKDSEDKDLTDYKFFCFGGEPKVMYITKENSGLPGMDFFDMDFNHLDLCMDDQPAKIMPEKPVCFEEMKRVAAVLSAGVPQLRVDFYQVNGKIYVGELTLYHGSGLTKTTPAEWNQRLAEWIVLPKE